jgi:hypothetical protein
VQYDTSLSQDADRQRHYSSSLSSHHACLNFIANAADTRHLKSIVPELQHTAAGLIQKIILVQQSVPDQHGLTPSSAGTGSAGLKLTLISTYLNEFLVANFRPTAMLELEPASVIDVCALAFLF